MTQVEARNAVKKIYDALEFQLAMGFKNDEIQDILVSLGQLERQLAEHKQATPNCRRATPEELETLCHASNVVMFPAVA